DLIQGFYADFLHRTGEPTANIDYWVGLWQQGERAEAVIADLLGSDAYCAPGDMATANQRFVARAYFDLLGRPVDPTGLTFWTGRLAQGDTPTQVIRDILRSDEYRIHALQHVYRSLLGRPVDAVGQTFFL